MVKLEGFRGFQGLKVRTVQIVQHVYKRHLDTTIKRERESCRMATTTTDKGKGLECPMPRSGLQSLRLTQR